MSSNWEQEITTERVYLPADGHYGDNKGLSIDEEIQNYIKREFPLPEGYDEVCSYSIPNEFIQHGEKQGCAAEEVSHRIICDVQLPKDREAELGCDQLWQACFQGICYAGRSNRGCREGKLMSKEHDLIVFNIYRGKYFFSMIEVKSTCDIPNNGYIISDSNSIKNSKRSAQHQLRDHLEIIKQTCDVHAENLHCHIFWPFLTKWTTDSGGKKARRWAQEADQHVFMDTLSDQQEFNQWFYKNVLCGKSIEKSHFDTLFKRFIILSSGVFVDEIHKGMLAILSQQQVSLLYMKPFDDGSPTVIHGAAGTGKTLLVLHKLYILFKKGLLNENNRALYICYWPGIRADFRRRLDRLKISQYVDTYKYFIMMENELPNRFKYRHIFMDECEGLCLAFKESIIANMFTSIKKCRKTDYDEEFYAIQKNHYPSSSHKDEKTDELYGDLWYMVDINQIALFIPNFSPNIFIKPHIVFSKVFRNTGTIYKLFKQFFKMSPSAFCTFSKACLQKIDLGHDINGPPVYWANTDIIDSVSETTKNDTLNTLVRVIIDLYSTKGIKLNHICVLPFFTTTTYRPDSINEHISPFFVKDGYRPVCISSAEDFSNCEENNFLVSWVLGVKGLEFKVVIATIDQGDFDYMDPEDRRKLYVMVSRCSCLLILVSSESVKTAIDTQRVIKSYPFGINF